MLITGMFGPEILGLINFDTENVIFRLILSNHPGPPGHTQYLLFILLRQNVGLNLSPHKIYVNSDKTGFATKERKLEKSRILHGKKYSINCITKNLTTKQCELYYPFSWHGRATSS